MKRREGIIVPCCEVKRSVAWPHLLLGLLLEIDWAVGLKYTDGFTVLLPSVLTGTGIIISFALLTLAVRAIAVGTAYAMFTGIGAGGIDMKQFSWTPVFGSHSGSSS